jgi:hypothetical protein
VGEEREREEEVEENEGDWESTEGGHILSCEI